MSSFVVYNNICLNVTELIAFSRIPVYDGPTYLYSKVSLHVRCVYNPNVVSYVPDPIYKPYIIPLAQDGSYPAVTDAAIRFELQQPRGLLLYVSGGHVLLQSPGFQPDRKTLYPCDARSGPSPTVHSIVEQIGRKTFVVDFAVETFVNESWNEMVVAPVVLSHRWTRRHDIDEDFYSTITTHGSAIFRADILSVFQKNAGGGAATAKPNYADRILPTAAVPDDFRHYLFHGVPNGFKRVYASVTPSPDGMSIEYSLVDREVNVLFPDEVTRIVATQSIGTKSGAGLAFLKSVYDAFKGPRNAADQNILEDRDRELAALGNMSNWNPAKWWGVAQQHVSTGAARVANFLGDEAKKGPGSLLDLASNNIFAVQDLLRGNLIPMMTVNINVGVWGHPDSYIETLTDVAYGVAVERLDAIGLNVGTIASGSTGFSFNQSLVDNFVTLSATKSLPLPKAYKFRGNGFSALPDVTGMITELAEGSSVFREPNPGMDIPNFGHAYLTQSLAAQLFLATMVGTEAPKLRPAPKYQNLP